MAEKSVITFKEKVGYGLGDMSSSMFWKIFGMYLLFFYTKVFGLSPAAAGTMFLLTRIWDAVNDPIMGLISDRTHTRWGKYRPYLLWGAFPFALIGVMTFFTPDWSEGGKLAYAYLTYTLMMMVYTVVNVPYASLLGVMSPSPKDRTTLSSYRMFFAFIGSFITFIILQPLIDFFGGKFDAAAASAAVVGEPAAESVGAVEPMAEEAVAAAEAGISTNPMAWTCAVAVIGVICVILFLLCFKLCKERVQPVDEDAQKKTSVGKDLMLLLKNAPWWILLVAGLASLLFNAIRDTVALFYFSDYVTSTYRSAALGLTMGTVYLLVGQAANMIGVALAAPISARIGKKATFISAMLIASVLSFIFFGFKPDQITMILVFQVLISICAGIVLPLLWSMYADIVDYQELKTGRRASGLILSSSSMSQKFGWAVGGAIAGWLLAAYGYDQNAAVQSESAVQGVRMMISIFPAVACILSAIFMLFYKLGEKKMKEVTEALEAKRAK